MITYLCPNLSTPERVNAALRVIDCFEKQMHCPVMMDEHVSQQLFGNGSRAGDVSQASLIVSVGGDGSVLRAAQVAVRANLPLLGINSGRLGYLCALELNELSSFDSERLHGLWAEYRTMLSIELNGKSFLALNIQR